MDRLTEKLSRRNLEKEIPILRAQIVALYQKLDQRFHLRGAHVQIKFGYDREVLGSYTAAKGGEKEFFYFSLYYIGYDVEHPMKIEDRMDLYKHEYAHYMQYHMEIPREYLWKPGIHGSAWKYCCSLVGAAPTPYYKVGEALRKHDYEKVLTSSIHDKSVPIRDQYRREREYQDRKNRQIKYQKGQSIRHPRFGNGIIEEIEQLTGSVRLHIRFGKEVKKIDQKWLLRTGYRAGGSDLK